MEMSDYQKNIQNLISKLTPELLTEILIVAPAIKLLGMIKKRISKEGLNTAGGKIGNYSTNPFYVTKDRFVKASAFKPQGKHTTQVPVMTFQIGKKGTTVRRKETTTAVSGKTYRVEKNTTMYLKEGYKELREIQGMPVDKVDLTYRGSLLADYNMGRSGQYVLLGFRTVKEGKKRDGLEAKYGKIFSGTNEEMKEYSNSVMNRYKKYVRDLLISGYGSANVSSDL